jgi:hypothetical protein
VAGLAVDLGVELPVRHRHECERLHHGQGRRTGRGGPAALGGRGVNRPVRTAACDELIIRRDTADQRRSAARPDPLGPRGVDRW